MNGEITIISCGAERTYLPNVDDHRLEKTDVLAGSKRLLSEYPDFSGKKFILGADTTQTVETLCDLAIQGRQVVVLASGDALFYGIGGTFSRLPAGRLEQFNLSIRPAPTAFQSLFARLKLPWEKARFFSLHQDDRIPVREILSAPLAVIYGGSRINAVQAAAALVESFPEYGTRPAVLAENLGFNNERINTAPLKDIVLIECGPISMLVLLENSGKDECPPLALGLGLENDFYEHEKGLITSPEIRCAALAKLRLPPAGVLWDIGAGSGSVGLEAAALRPRMEVHALEKKPQRVVQIKENAKRLGVANIYIQTGTAPDGFSTFPQPQRIFIGGGGEHLEKILEAGFAALKPDGIIVVAAITMEALAQLSTWRPENCLEAVQISVARMTELAGKY
ncbi:MAG: precorrin-6Y C5,15-methyltransferase (decarboxylating) subunit CbiT, partial [Pseudomonadota bacterium]|nr:precorrin-6Y C5,15-methyltransferase (decarboxylating) subunit CbiT [Pseudomonadota bacterium]